MSSLVVSTLAVSTLVVSTLVVGSLDARRLALGRVLTPGPVLHVDGYAGPVYDGVPAIGEHTREVLSGLLSLSDDDLAGLAASGTVRIG